MLNNRLTVFAFLAAAGFALPAAATPIQSECSIADITVGTLPYSDSGCFNQDDNEQSFLFTLDSAQTVDLFTSSWPGGGFAPVLTLFNDVDNSFIAADEIGGQAPDSCGARVIGGTDNENTCLDAYISAVLNAGSYRLVLTEVGNTDLIGDDLVSHLPYVSCVAVQTGNSYSQCGNGNFTSPGGFASPNNLNPLGNNWTVSILAETISADAPEPATSLFGLSGLILVGLLARRRAGVRVV